MGELKIAAWARRLRSGFGIIDRSLTIEALFERESGELKFAAQEAG